MRLGIVGLPQAGKTTIFAALTGARGEGKDLVAPRVDAKIGTITVFDERVDFLIKAYRPKKTTYAKIEYLLPSEIPAASLSKSTGEVWNQARICDALLHVVRNFTPSGGMPATPEKDFWQFEEEMILNDFVVAGDDRIFHPAKAVIKDTVLEVWSRRVNNPISVRYCWKNYAEGSLYNNAGLPASSFRTDDWEK